MPSPRFSEYSEGRLGGRSVPEDLRALLELQWQRTEIPNPLAPAHDQPDPLAAMDIHILEVGESHVLLDHSYLTPKDEADQDIMANVAAIREVCGFATFVAVDRDRNLFGYWFGPENCAIEYAPIVRLDTEGQFTLMKGATLIEALVGDYAFDDDDEFARLSAWLAKCSVRLESACWSELPQPSSVSDPSEMHLALYSKHRARAGLPPVVG